MSECQRETDFNIFDEYHREKNKNGSYDYGAWQINDCHWKGSDYTIYKELKKLGLWDEKSGEWICHPRTNSLARVVIVDERIKRLGGEGNINETLLKILRSVE